MIRIIEQAYAAFNRRDIEAAVKLMTPTVSWPKASEGGTIVGPDAIRAYWTRQWSDFDPHVEPLQMKKESPDKISVRVRQLVKSLDGDILSDTEVLHIFTLSGGFIAAMHLGDDTETSVSPSTAFTHRS